MTDQEKQKLNEKLAVRFLGIKKIFYGEWDSDKSWPMYIPSGKPWRTHQIDARPVPQFTASLDACFKLLVPKLLEKELSVSITVDVANSLAIIRDKFDKTPAIWRAAHREHPELAFCLAIEKLIDLDVNRVKEGYKT